MAQLIARYAGDDAEAVAARLLARFGSLHQALTSTPHADEADTTVLDGLRAAHQLVAGAAREDMRRAIVSSFDPALRDYLRQLLGSQRVETLHAIYLDPDHGYLADEPLAHGSVEQLPITTRALLVRALALGARGVILAHNHPSGAAAPSMADLDVTSRLQALLGGIDVTLLDHLIVTRSAVFSLRQANLL